MTATHEEIAGGGRDDGIGLFGSAGNGSTAVDSGRIMAWKRPDSPAVEQRSHLPISRSAVESSESPTAVVGRRSSETPKEPRREISAVGQAGTVRIAVTSDCLSGDEVFIPMEH